MFGYLQPDKNELKLRDYKLYKSLYCGLCRSMGKEYGLVSRLTLNYDCTVLAMLSMSLTGEKCSLRKGHCNFAPYKKCLFCISGGESMRFAGAVSVIMAYYKLVDTKRDSGLLKKVAASVAGLFLSGSHRRAAAAYPEIEAATAEMMDAQQKAEMEKSSTDAAAQPTAGLISKLCEGMAQDDKEKHILQVFGYYVGRWIYLMDAADDLPKDLKSRSFNPFAAEYDGDMSSAMNRCNEALNLTASQLLLAYELIPQGRFSNILDNIVYNGIPNMQKLRLFDKFNRRCKNKEELT